MKRHSYSHCTYVFTPDDLDEQRREAIVDRLSRLPKDHRPRFGQSPNETLELLVEERLDRVERGHVRDAIEEQLEYDLAAHETVRLGQRVSRPVVRYEICLGYE